MTQDERWQKRYQEVKAFEKQLALAEENKHVNQWR